MANALYPKWKEAILQATANSALNGSGAAGGLVITVSTHDAKVCTVYVVGGTVGVAASITCKISTVGGRVEERTVYFNIR